MLYNTWLHMVTHGKLLAHYGNVVWLNANMRTDSSTKRKH